jgi:TatA/E family protein of Tat protein translocase
VLTFSPVKLLIVIVVAAILVGPDRVPQVARQLGAAWKAFRAFHERVEQEVRDNIPELPSTAEIARLARSPVAFLNQLADLPKPESVQVGAGNGTNGTSGIESSNASESAAVEGLTGTGTGSPSSPTVGGPTGFPANGVEEPGAGRSTEATGGQSSGTTGAAPSAPDPSMN